MRPLDGPETDPPPILIPLPAPITPAAELPARIDGPTLNLLGLILTGLRPQSRAGYQADYRDFARFAACATAEQALWRLLRQAQAVANAMALAYHADMADRGLSPATIARRLAALKRAARRARLAGLTTISLETEPPKAESFRDTRGPGAAGWRKLLDQAEAEAGDGTARTARNLAILLLLHDRALRRGEAVALDYPDDLDLTLTRPAIQILGKGKTSKEWLTINDRCRAALARWIELARWVELKGDWPGPLPLFTRCDPAARTLTRLTGESVNRMVQALAKRAGLMRTVRAHGLRHQAITEALDGGWDVRDVKQFSRHAKIDTVLIYDDRRKDIGGEITRAIGRPKRASRKSA
jgi:integrase/recombinase XerC